MEGHEGPREGSQVGNSCDSPRLLVLTLSKAQHVMYSPSKREVGVEFVEVTVIMFLGDTR